MAMSKEKIYMPMEKLYPLLIYEFVIGKLPSTETYEERLLWQKVGYIAQQLGTSLDDYIFSWYLAGPYSPGYTAVLFNSSHIADMALDYTLTDYVKRKIEPMKEIVENTPIDMSIPKWFELIASLLFIKNNSGLNKKNDILKKLTRKKPFFNDEGINCFAWDLLENLNGLK